MKKVLLISLVLLLSFVSQAQMEFTFTIKDAKNTQYVDAKQIFHNGARLRVGNKYKMYSTMVVDYVEIYTKDFIKSKFEGYNYDVVKWIEPGTYTITGSAEAGFNQNHIVLNNGKGEINITKVDGHKITGTFTMSNNSPYDYERVDCSGSFKNLPIDF